MQRNLRLASSLTLKPTWDWDSRFSICETPKPRIHHSKYEQVSWSFALVYQPAEFLSLPLSLCVSLCLLSMGLTGWNINKGHDKTTSNPESVDVSLSRIFRRLSPLLGERKNPKPSGAEFFYALFCISMTVPDSIHCNSLELDLYRNLSDVRLYQTLHFLH